MWRGRGRRGGGQRNYAKPQEYIIFPEIKELPDVNLKQKEEKYRKLVSWGNELQKFWNSSPYHLGPLDQVASRNEGKRKDPLSDYIQISDDYFPAELVAKNVRPVNKKMRWNPESDIHKLDLLEKLDAKTQADHDDRVKKEEEDENEDNENVEEEEEEEDLGDYEQNVDFDDDEDDYNPEDDGGGDDGGYY
ncbi:uncharacterized protein [Rutidosis leptorrhynchoides]|uniref:uncharacterized protein n=1 Tax=Rutidosis leptorrhynchoides TaxID=125765 RepID=UPI003A9A5A21